jgi:hypothetical protein
MTLNIFVGYDSLNFVQEWRSVAFKAFGINEIIILVLLFLTLYQGVKLPFWRLLLVLALIYLMFAHVRFAGLFAVTAPLLLAGPLAEQFSYLRLKEQLNNETQLFGAMARFSRRFTFLLSTLVAAGVVTFGIYGPPMRPASEITPSGAVDYIVAHNLQGNLYNTYNFGGYLIFRGIKTFVDGRSDQLFNEGDFIARLYDIVGKHPKMFLTYLNEYRIDMALVEPASIEAQELDSSTTWKKVYSDNVSELFEKVAS